eukprot:symbB.v1.2.007864.t1/scaffold448.1/size203282/16
MPSFLIHAFQADAVNTYLAPEPPKPQFSFFDWLQACCVEKPPGDQDYRLRQKEEIVIGHLQQEVATTFQANSPEPWLQCSTRQTLPQGRRDPRWKLLGFQDEDPRTDFRGGGLLSLKCLIWMTNANLPRVARLIRESRGEGDLDADQWYPFAAAVINVCFELLGRRDGGKVPPEELCNGFEYRRFAELTAQEPEFFLMLATAAVVAMHEEWCSKKYSVLEFRKCIRVAIKRVSNFLSLSAKEPADKALAGLRATWQLPTNDSAIFENILSC